MNAYTFLTLPTPVGPFSVALDATRAIAATAFGQPPALALRLPLHAELVPARSEPANLRREVAEYFAGERRAFTVPLAARGTAFQRQVWAGLARLPFGATCSYAELAAAIGRPGAARAVGRANATNPLCLLVPCHRVVGADGSLTGFAFGTALKRRLLEHERAVGARATAA